jgi:hypothetical protein
MMSDSEVTKVLTTDTIPWIYGEPADKSAKMLLLTRFGTAIVAIWDDGMNVRAHCPLPKRDKAYEKEHGIEFL